MISLTPVELRRQLEDHPSLCLLFLLSFSSFNGKEQPFATFIASKKKFISLLPVDRNEKYKIIEFEKIKSEKVRSEKPKSEKVK